MTANYLPHVALAVAAVNRETNRVNTWARGELTELETVQFCPLIGQVTQHEKKEVKKLKAKKSECKIISMIAAHLDRTRRGVLYPGFVAVITRKSQAVFLIFKSE